MEDEALMVFMDVRWGFDGWICGVDFWVAMLNSWILCNKSFGIFYLSFDSLA
jgi:hypothetical protein